VVFSLAFTETDPGPDQTGRYTRFLSAYAESQRVEADVSLAGSLGFGGCTVRLRYDREVSLIANVPQNGTTAVFAPT